MAYTVRKQDVWEVFQEFTKAKNRKQRIEILKKNEDNMPLRDVLQGAFDARIQWNLPPGTPPYTPQQTDAPTPSTLLKEHLKFKYFVKGLRESEDLLPVRRERLFIDILEVIDARDAEAVVAMINKKPPVQGLTEKIVKEALPDLIP